MELKGKGVVVAGAGEVADVETIEGLVDAAWRLSELARKAGFGRR